MTQAQHIHTSTQRHPHAYIGEMRYFRNIPIFVKHVDPLKHKLRIFDGYGIQETVFGDLAFNDGFVVIIENKERYLVSQVKDWIQHGIIRVFNELDGKQRFLSTDPKFMQPFTDKTEALRYITQLEGVEMGLLNPTNRNSVA
jgi:hypothetical protein